MKYSFPKSILMSSLDARANEVYTMAKACGWTSHKMQECFNERLVDPINERYQSGKRKHSVWLSGYVAGLISSVRSRIWQEDVEFCYIVDGVIYSTHKNSSRPTTEQFYLRDEGRILCDAEGYHYWKNTDKAYT